MSRRSTAAARPVLPFGPSSPDRQPRSRRARAIRQATMDRVDGVSCSYVLSLRPFRRCAAAPKDFGLNGEHVAVFLRVPCFRQLPFDRFHTAFNKTLVLYVRNIGEPQHRGRLLQLFEEHVETRLPLDADFGRTWLECL